jgi:hypothetical protein
MSASLMNRREIAPSRLAARVALTRLEESDQ